MATVCSICRRPIDPEAPDTREIERLEDMPGFGQEHDFSWQRAGVAHASCRLPRKHRYAGDDGE